MNGVTRLFPVWALAASALAWAFPQYFTSAKPAIVPLLGVVMFGMGITLTPGDFKRVLKRPRVILVGVSLQFLLMPLLGWILVTGAGLGPALAVGVILVGSCPGGTASNVICYLARGDVALSITLTSVSTLLAVVVTPFLTWVYAGQMVPVPMLSMFLSILKIVFMPVLLGVLVNYFWRAKVSKLSEWFPLFSVAAIVIIIAIIVALNQTQLHAIAGAAVLVVALHNFLGLVSGFWLAHLFGFSVREARTLAIEVGMQNSGLGVALAVKYFSAAAALPGALFSIWHNLSGSLLAAYWSRQPVINK